MQETALAVLRQLLLFGMLLMPLELLFPARASQRLLRRGAITDLVYFAVNPFLINLGMVLVLAGMSAGLDLLLPMPLRATLARQPLWLQLVEIFLIAELSGYWIHRLSHRIGLLWRFHAVHHSNTELDWLAAHRQHPLEAIWLLAVANLPVLLLGFPMDSMLIVVLLQKLYTAFLHANVRIGYGRFGQLIASPQFHHWHHDADAPHRAPDCNFSSVLSILDRLWGTYRVPPAFPQRYGIDEPIAPDYARQLAHPIRRP